MLAKELAAQHAQHVKPVDGGVHFAGTLALGYAVNLHSRVASRVLWHVGRAPYRATTSDQDIYDATLKIDWPNLFTVDRTLRVNVSAIKAPVKSLDFITLRIKDAICDMRISCACVAAGGRNALMSVVRTRRCEIQAPQAAAKSSQPAMAARLPEVTALPR